MLRNTVTPLLVLAASCCAAPPVWAQAKPMHGMAFAADCGVADRSVEPPLAPDAKVSAPAGAERGVDEWLARLRQAGHVPAYTGTYVVWSAPGLLASSRIWHASQGDVQVERVDTLSGVPRSTYRATDRRDGGGKINTFLPGPRVVRVEQGGSSSGGVFPNVPVVVRGISLADYYDARQTGQERVAGFMTDVVQFMPRDSLRYGYRVWSEQCTGLAIRLQTLDERGRVLEQVAFSGLTFDPSVNTAALLREMHRRRGWRLEHVERAPTTAAAEGWQIGSTDGPPVPGFALQHCYRKPVLVQTAKVSGGNSLPGDSVPERSVAPGEQGDAAGPHWLQCVFSDGLAAVSVFIEPYDPAQHDGGRASELDSALGATHLMARRVGDTGWVAAVGEVPPQTLRQFVAGVSRLP